MLFWPFPIMSNGILLYVSSNVKYRLRAFDYFNPLAISLERDKGPIDGIGSPLQTSVERR